MQEPALLPFLLHIAGAAALLIWSVRLVRTGVERAFATQLRQSLRHASGNRVLAAGTGTLAAMFLQSSTAVAVLVANFVAKGSLAPAIGLAILLGADVGSAVVSQILLIPQDFLVPLLLLAGVVLFLRGQSGTLRQTGRILIGLALIFASLDMIRDATAPMVDSAGTQAVMAYLGRDIFTAFAVGALFAWAVHSSVAAVLLFVTLAAQSLLPVEGAAAMVLGANLGGAFIAYVLTLASPASARQMICANLLLRGGGAAVLLLVLAQRPDLLDYLGADASRQAINLHLAFNAALALAALGLIHPFSALAAKVVTSAPDSNATTLAEISALDPHAMNRPGRGLDSAARELLRMGQKIEGMLNATGPLYDQWDATAATAIREQDKTVKKIHFEIKLYLAQLGRDGLDEDLAKRSMELAGISTAFEAASDTIVRSLLTLAKRRDSEGFAFSEVGRREIGDFLDRVQGNVHLALNVMMNQNPAEARDLVEAKEKVRAVEQKLQRNHLGRLREGLTESIETSSIHQETLRSLKQINTSFSMVGYPILARTGDLLKSRLS
ncbi:Na+/Pi-cotransporter (plasmid) [Sulfitobacter sp. THAF37]|uniref:Na/Pi cotransporter family protein n=1 Tax=Sulfitobacter sp. THAF37 TaxID=2587855 RepID=UPI0012AA7A3B|nr:Na/Pi cotransporter family protein [Sulfitobacter sp. THAF37]QFT61076.1 Na+/Pi-cotransporter [Sulfitobacter sp. THAF37]